MQPMNWFDLTGKVAVVTGGSRGLAVAYHAASWTDADRLAEVAYTHMGRVDVLVNNAGMSPLYPSVDAIGGDLHDKVMGVNLKGPFRELHHRCGAARGRWAA
jgi:NAD(P)-dependent dehydrogenase (short-subunit alcohol dehydrogenase family)